MYFYPWLCCWCGNLQNNHKGLNPQNGNSPLLFQLKKFHRTAIVKNTALNFLAKERRRIDCGYSFFEGQVEQSSSPEELLISEELFQRYVKALDELPKRCREVFIRIREEKQSYAQVANELGISVKTVDAQLQKATKKLKQKLL